MTLHIHSPSQLGCLEHYICNLFEKYGKILFSWQNIILSWQNIILSWQNIILISEVNLQSSTAYRQRNIRGLCDCDTDHSLSDLAQ